MGSLLDALISWSVERRAIVLLGTLALLLAGALAASRASLDVLPDFMPPRVVVQTEAPGLSTLDVEELVTRPIERALLGTPSAASVRSTSAPGLSAVTLLFDEEVDVYRARQLVLERVAVAQGRLPATVHAPQLAPLTAPIAALLKFCLTTSATDARQGLRDLRAFADWTLRPRLLGLPGVAQVTIHGGEVERIEVRPDPLRMQARGVTLADLSAAVQRSQSLSGAGFVETAGARLDVRSEARLSLADAPQTLAEMPLESSRGTPGRLPLRLGDVAEIVHAAEPRVGAALYDGRPAVYVQVNKLPGADTLNVTREVEAALKDLKRALSAQLPQARIEPPVFRQASFVTTALRSVGRAMLIGALLVVCILVAFLRSGRLAVISLTAIPLSLLGAALVLLACGASINGMTLGGLAIAVGEVVDDAIVDVENIWRRLRENAQSEAAQPALSVIRSASKEVRGSVVYATVIVCLVLVPVLLLGGIAGRIFAPLAQAYILAILVSLGVALTVTPALCAWLLPRLATAESHSTALATFLLTRYRRTLAHVAAHPGKVLGSAALLTAAALAALPWLGGRFLPDFQEGCLIANLNAVPGASLPETLRLTERVDAQLRPGLAAHVAARVGRAELDEDAFPVNRVEMDVVLKPDAEGDAEQQAGAVAQGIGRVAGLGFAVEGFLSEHIHDILAGETAPVVVHVLGPELPTLRSLTAEVARQMAGVPALGHVRVEAQLDVPQIHLKPRPTALARWRIPPGELAEQVTAWRHGRPLTQILEPSGRVIDVAIAGSEAQRAREALADLPISASGKLLPLSELAVIEDAAAPALIHHLGGERHITIGASAPGSSLSQAVTKLRATLAHIQLPDGYHIEVGGEATVRKQAALRLLALGALILLGIYVLLSTAFGSMRDAGIVLLNLPLGLIGGVLAALFLPDGLSVAGFVGFVTLFGIIARNGILLVAHKRHLDLAHPDLPPAARVLRAAEERLLPILMTAATAGLGLLPLALSVESAGSELEAPMAMIVCGGLLSSTALNMLVLPTLYVWLAARSGRAS